VQPVVDLGLGCTPGESPFAVGRAAAVSPAFAARALPRLVEACRARGIAATVGARYPARHRENLLQLFTPRYAEDGRPLVRALAALAPLVDAVQLELGIALRWPGPWRARLVAACTEALPALLAASHPAGALPGDTTAAAPAPPVPRRLEFAGAALSGLVGLDAGGGASLALTLGLHGGEASGFLCRDGRHVAVAAAHAALGPADAPLAHVGLELELVDGRRLRIAARALHRLPVIRARGRAPVR